MTRHFVRYPPPLLDFLALACVPDCQLVRYIFTVCALMERVSSEMVVRSAPFEGTKSTSQAL